MSALATRPPETVATLCEAHCLAEVDDGRCSWSGKNAAVDHRQALRKAKAHAEESGHRVIVSFMLEPWS